MRLALALAFSLVLGSAHVPLHVRSAQTGAVCTGDYAWMTNSKGDSPCLLAAKVDGACNGGNWNIPGLTAQNDGYNSPNSSTANLCTCSWTAYNLINACSTCQGYQNTIQGWGPYKLACTAATLSNAYFPTNEIPLPDGTAIPAWAAIDPSQWASQTFSPTQAKQIADQGKPDLVVGTPASSSGSQKSSTPVGAIAGGVVGGVAVLLLGGGMSFYMIRKRRQQSQNPISPTSNGYTGAPKDPGNGHTMSDLPQRSANTAGLAYSRLDSFSPTQAPQSPLLPTNATIHTHASSVHSLSYFGSAVGSTAYPATSIGQSASPQPISLSPHPVNQEDIIVPYTVPLQGALHQGSDRKRADGVIVLAYDPPTSAPELHGDWPISSGRPRFNPPEYTPHAQPVPNDSSSNIQAPSSGTRPNHWKSGSADTQRSWDSSAGNTPGIRSGHGPGGGAVILDDAVQRMGFDSPQSDHGHSVSPTSGSNVTGLSGRAEGGMQNRVMM